MLLIRGGTWSEFKFLPYILEVAEVRTLKIFDSKLRRQFFLSLWHFPVKAREFWDFADSGLLIFSVLLWLAKRRRLISLRWTVYQNLEFPTQEVKLSRKMFDEQRILQISAVRSGSWFSISMPTYISHRKCAFHWLWTGSQTFSVDVELLCSNTASQPETFKSRYLKQKYITNFVVPS